MLATLRKLILLLLIASLPLQGVAAGVKALAPHGQPAEGHVMAMDGEMAVMHGGCHGQQDNHDASPAHPLSPCGDGAHCPLCNVSIPPAVAPAKLSGDAPALYPAPALHISLFYPELPQRPPLSRFS